MTAIHEVVEFEVPNPETLKFGLNRLPRKLRSLVAVTIANANIFARPKSVFGPSEIGVARQWVRDLSKQVAVYQDGTPASIYLITWDV